MARSDASIFNRMFDVVQRNAVAIAVPWESRDGCACEPIGRTARSPVEGQSVTRIGSDNWRSITVHGCRSPIVRCWRPSAWRKPC